MKKCVVLSFGLLLLGLRGLAAHQAAAPAAAHSPTIAERKAALAENLAKKPAQKVAVETGVDVQGKVSEFDALGNRRTEPVDYTTGNRWSRKATELEPQDVLEPVVHGQGVESLQQPGLELPSFSSSVRVQEAATVAASAVPGLEAVTYKMSGGAVVDVRPEQRRIVNQTKAVTALQARVRGNVARQEVGLLRNEQLMKQEVDAALQEPASSARQEKISEVGDKWAIKIRSNFMQTKSPALRRGLIKMSKELAVPIQRDAAATTIQSAVRQRTARKHAQEQLAELREQRKQEELVKEARRRQAAAEQRVVEARDSQIATIKEKINNELHIAQASARIQAMPRPKISGIIDLALAALPKMATRAERQEQLYSVETALHAYIKTVMAEAKTKPQRELLKAVSGLIAQKIDQLVSLP